RSDRWTVRKLTGLIVAGAGVGLILTVDQAAGAGVAALDAPSLAGDLVLILSAVLLAIRITYTKHALQKMETGKLIFWQDLLGVGLFLAYGVLGESFRLADLTSVAIWGLLYQGVVVAGFCFAMHASLLRKHSASQLAVFSFTTPLFGVMLASLLRSDPLSAWLLVSAVCVALGIYLVNSGKKKVA
ncbi:MAG: DMT family transporter, partial [Pirellulales bacterium]|nr:DMT family transporter [Pirellulales bacterium]